MQVRDEANQKYVQHHMTPFMDSKIIDTWERGQRGDPAFDAFKGWCFEMKGAMNQVMLAGIRSVVRSQQRDRGLTAVGRCTGHISNEEAHEWESVIVSHDDRVWLCW